MPWYSIFTMKKDLDRICKAAKRKSCNYPESLSKPGEEIKSILSSKDSMSWPPKQSKLTVDAVEISDSVWAFLSTLLTGNTEPQKFCSQRVQCLANSFGQDLVFGVTNGGVETPKHMLLPYAVKSLTNNVELIQIINLFGRGVSYSQIEELNTTLCLEKLAAIAENMIPLPDNIKPYNIPTSLASDNIERVEETLLGEGTSHCVNRITVQAQHFGPYYAAVEGTPQCRKIKETKCWCCCGEGTSCLWHRRVLWTAIQSLCASELLRNWDKC